MPTILTKLRTLSQGSRGLTHITRPSFNVRSLSQAVSQDQGISSRQREGVLDSLKDPEFMGELKGGAIGAALSFLVAKYLKLKPTTQVLLSLAGFGVGKLIHDYKHNPGNFSRYNEKLKMHEIVN